MKAGTTSLFSYLRNHPQVFMPDDKEPGYFSNPDVWNRGIEWYASLFSGAGSAVARGEASVNYTKYPHYQGVPERIRKVLPDVRLIYILRSPVERVYSHYLHNFYAGIERDPIQVALEKRPLYIQTSLYHRQLQQYLAVFPEEQIRVLLLDDLQFQPLEVVQSLFSFLEVDQGFVPRNISEVRHRSAEKRGVDNALMKRLRRLSIYPSLNERLSGPVRSISQFFLKKSVADPPKLGAGERMEIWKRLRRDVDSLSKYLKRDLSMWTPLV